eukprot:m.29196 g.29196  ORF g.29196 m.29196 type:complete len:780 (-) comp9142_c0_seq2:287-2626(-)
MSATSMASVPMSGATALHKQEDGAQTVRKEGWLTKWTNYMKGWQRRYFVLEKGMLMYFRSPEERHHTCRGSVIVANTQIENASSNGFSIYAGSRAVFHLRAYTEKDRQEWINALQLAKVGTIRLLTGLDDCNAWSSSDGEDGDGVDDDDDDSLADVSMAMDAPTHPSGSSDRPPQSRELKDKWEKVKVAAGALSYAAGGKQSDNSGVQSAAKSLLSATRELFDVSIKHHKRWKSTMQRMQAKVALCEGDDEDDDEFYDLDMTETPSVSVTGMASLSLEHLEQHTDGADDGVDGTTKSSDGGGSASARGAEEGVAESKVTSIDDGSPAARAARELPDVQTPYDPKVVAFKPRRSIPDRPSKNVSLWGIMKNCIGKDLSRIPMPVNFNEPISLTQRVLEDVRYYDLLYQAVTKDDPAERMAYVATFVLSAFAATFNRTFKPFNPLLGETFEMDRTATLGWRAIAEQVSHHPPRCAFHVESADWIVWQDFSLDSKFRGKYLQMIPTGASHIILKASGDHYSWRKCPTTVHNIIVGKLWLEHHGTFEVKNVKTGHVASIKITPYSIFSSSEARRVAATVRDVTGKAHFELSGMWESHLDMQIAGQEHTKRNIWRDEPRSPNSAKMYNMHAMALQFNEFTPAEAGCCQTDSRFRPDKNLMEITDWDMANRVKHLLEEAQRFRRKQYEQTQTKWSPVWFDLLPDPVDPSRKVFQYNGKYWAEKAKRNEFADVAKSATPIVGIYDVSPVAHKDADAAASAVKAMIVNDHSGYGIRHPLCPGGASSA